MSQRLVVWVQLSGEFAVTSAEQVRQLEALKRLEQGLLVTTQDDAGRFRNLVIRLHHPDSCVFDPFGNIAELEGSSSQVQVTHASCTSQASPMNVTDQGLFEIISPGS